MGSSLRRSHRAWLLKVFGVLGTCFAAGLVTAGVMSGTSALASLTTEPNPAEVAQSAAAERCAPAGDEAVWVDRGAYNAGAAVSIAGAGFEAACAVALRITQPDGSVSSEDTTTSPDGELEAAYAMPNPAIPGEYLLEALGVDDTALGSARFDGRPAVGDGPAVWTNKNDYMPGEMVLMLGSGWAPGETVELRVDGTPAAHGERTFSATADAAGSFELGDFRPDELDVGASFVLTATGRASELRAQTTFTDAITLGSSTTNQNGDPATSELTLQVPTATAGDLLLAHVTVEGLGTSEVICTPTGWNLILRTNNSSSTAQAIFRKVAAASEPISYTWRLRSNSGSCTGTSNQVFKGAVGGMTAYAGVDTATTNGIFGSAGTAGGSNTINSPAVGSVATPVPVGAGVVRYFGNDKEFVVTTSGGGSSHVYSVNRNKSGGGFIKPSGASAFGTHASGNTTAAATAANGGNGGNWVAQTIVLRVSANSPPSGTDKTITIAEDTPHTFSASDFGYSDPNAGDAMNGVRIDTLPAAGSLKLSGTNVTAGQLIAQVSIPNLVFASAPNASGAPYASFTFSVRDTNGPAFDTTPNTMTFNVTAVNDAPVCDDVSITTNENTADSTAPDCTDVDDPVASLTYSVTQPTNGAASDDDLNLSFDPDGDFEGLDTGEQDTTNGDFTYTANDGTIDSAAAAVAVTVTGVNDAPVCEDAAITTNENTADSTAPDCTDMDEEALTYSVTQPTKGVTSENGVALNFDPSGQYEGLDTGETDTTNGDFTYTANDSTVDSNTADVAVTVNGANDAPECEDVAITTNENTADSTAPDCTDVDDPVASLTYSVTQPTKGAVSEDDLNLSFDPDGDFEGLDTGEQDTTNGDFTYTADDAEASSAAADVEVTVNGVNDAPVCDDVSIAVSEDGPADSTAPDCTDVDEETLTYTVTQPTKGIASEDDVDLTFDPERGLREPGHRRDRHHQRRLQLHGQRLHGRLQHRERRSHRERRQRRPGMRGRGHHHQREHRLLDDAGLHRRRRRDAHLHRHAAHQGHRQRGRRRPHLRPRRAVREPGHRRDRHHQRRLQLHGQRLHRRLQHRERRSHRERRQRRPGMRGRGHHHQRKHGRLDRARLHRRRRPGCLADLLGHAADQGRRD